MTAIAKNVAAIKSQVNTNVKFCAVVKADAYGHGAIAIAREVLAAGADRLAVAILGEAIALRQAGILAPIQILGYTPAGQARAVAAYEIAQAVYALEDVQALSAAGEEQGKKVKIHIKIDTGMGRIGISPADAGEFAAAAAALPGVEIEGVFSHFATADEADKSYTESQFKDFKAALARIKAKGIAVPISHIANSAATLELPDMHLDMVRPGIILYGLWPSNEVKRNITLIPAMRLKAKVAFVKSIAAGTSVSYGRKYWAPAERLIATLPLGYADGWSRLLSNKTAVLLHGQRAPLVGRICMDQCMADVTDIAGVKTGEVATLFGVPELTTDEVAGILGTINYELVCMISKRVPRVYVK